MAAETVACLVLLFDFLVLALKSDELTCCATVKLNEQTTQCSKKKQQKQKKGGEEAEPEVAAAAAAETTGGATEAGMEVKAGTVQRQTETVALGHTATGLSPLSPSLCLALSPLLCLPLSLFVFLPLLLTRFRCLPRCLLHLFSFWFASVHQSPWVGFVSGSCSVGGATFATLGFGSAWVGLTAHSAFHCYCCYCSLFKCKFRRLEICKPNTKQIQKYIMKHVQTCLCSYCCSAYSCFYRLYCIILKYDGTR